ncbi:MAG: hypothetical protein E5V95_33485 [Mesorhizobium sp.]|uniref:hypothetical protein n=1 Tax=Mesorhizobium sp. TaxID=1871066 RepID=UPI0012141E1C|nr:hypothetical protein [Mesorhizobium sp.]TIV13621.1 MAG: hypothetical protein E5V95_33485 [Mesorhizobium sp.]
MLLGKIESCIFEIGNVDLKSARTLYDKAMRAAHESGRRIVHPDFLRRLHDQVYAAQELAYAYYLEHGQPIADDAVVPERAQHNIDPPGSKAGPNKGDQTSQASDDQARVPFSFTNSSP